MAARYLVEIRFGCELKRKLREIISDIADRFNEYTLVRSHYVPHVTLYGAFRTNRETLVLNRMRDVCAQYDVVPFRIDGFDHFDQETIFADVHSSRALRTLRAQLSEELQGITFQEPEYDHQPWFHFHSTVARDAGHKFREIWQFVNERYDLEYEGYVKRINLLKHGNIVKEYSLPQGRFLSSDAATASPAWEQDETIINRHRQPGDHAGLVPSQPGRLSQYRTRLTDRFSKKEAERRRLSKFQDRPTRTFLSGDLHLNHGNIIEYCNRPFDSTHEMNQQLVTNWNNTVGPDDTVIFLGDLELYYGDITAHDWLHALNGSIVSIRGNHDGARGIDYQDSYVLESATRRYYCTHRPDDIPEDWDGWAIHGHVHNNNTTEHPFIDVEARRVNVAPELMLYTPMSLDRLEAFIDHLERSLVSLG